MNQGLFITFEGGEGAGKTTLIDEVSRALALRGFEVLKTREPGGTRLGEHVRNLLLQHSDDYQISALSELSLFLTSRAQHVEEIILPSLKEDKIVLCDRFNDSTYAYQGVARGLGMEKVRRFCSFVCQQLEPHLTFYLDLDPAIGLRRTKAHEGSQYDRIESEKISFHQTVRKAFHRLAEEEPNRLFILNAEDSAKDVFKQAMDKIEPLLEGMEDEVNY